MRTTKALISAFVVRCLDSIISLDYIAEISKILASFFGTKRKTVGRLHVPSGQLYPIKVVTKLI